MTPGRVNHANNRNQQGYSKGHRRNDGGPFLYYILARSGDSELMVVPAVDPFEALVQTAASLKVSRLVTGVSPGMDSSELALRMGRAWERLAEPRHSCSLEIISEGRPSSYVNLGPHPPRLWPEDVDCLHGLWLKLSDRLGCELHHRDVLGLALRRLSLDVDGVDKEEIYQQLLQEAAEHKETAGKGKKALEKNFS